MIHVIDLDGSDIGQPINVKLLKQICEKLEIPVEIGGGVRSLVDIDHFKKVNDTYGHDEGDKVLKEVAKVLADKVRDTDLIGSKIVGRYGGEEMSILLPNTDLEGAKIVGERLRKSIQEEFKGTKTKITISAGVSTYNPEESIEQLYKSADEKLYRAKDQGRNKVIY